MKEKGRGGEEKEKEEKIGEKKRKERKRTLSLACKTLN